MENNDDLLQPSLNHLDDRAGFDNPWNPNSLLWVAFFGGILASGTLVALNDRKLGLKPRIIWLIPAIALVYLLTLGLVFAFTGAESAQAMGSRFRLISRIVSLAGTFLLILPQRSRFRIFETGELPAAPLFKTGLLACVLAGAVNLVVLSLLFSM